MDYKGNQLVGDNDSDSDDDEPILDMDQYVEEDDPVILYCNITLINHVARQQLYNQ